MTAEQQPQTLLHIAPLKRWQRADRFYTDPSLHTDGFIHCSTIDQILTPANERFNGCTDLVILVIDAGAVHADIVYEDCYEAGTAFPHIYGPLPTGAVTNVVAFPPNADGSFSLPPGITVE